MIKMTPTIADDQPQINDWMLKDPYHCRLVDVSEKGWWLTGCDSLLAGCIEDSSGPVVYFRLDKVQDKLVRMHIQFAPLEQVSKSRTARVILQALPVFQELATQNGAEGFVFESVSEPLIKFMGVLGFKLEKDNDYVLMFGEVK